MKRWHAAEEITRELPCKTSHYLNS